MNDKFVNMVFKIGVLLIGVAFLVVYYFHSQNGRFYKFGDDKDTPFSHQILDTRTGIVYHSFSGKDIPLMFFSMNITNGKLKLYDMDRIDERNYRAPIAPAPAPGAPAAPAPGAPAAPNKSKQSAEDFLKGKK